MFPFLRIDIWVKLVGVLSRNDPQGHKEEVGLQKSEVLLPGARPKVNVDV